MTQKFKLLVREAFLHRKFVVWLFVSVSLAAVCVGIVWPKVYTSSANIYFEYKNVIDPLMEGTAVRTDVADLAANASEVVYGRSALLQVLKQGGWLGSNPSPQRQEQLAKELKSRTIVQDIGKNLIKIEYKDQDPERAFATTKIWSDLLINEMLREKTKESQAAFEFIDNEVKKYEAVLSSIQARLKQLRNRDVDAQPELSGEVQSSINKLSARIDDLEQALRDAKIARESLREQLTGETTAYTALMQTEREQARLAELQAELATLSLDYKETHPDIIRVKQQIAELQNSIKRAEQKSGALADTALYYNDENVKSDNLYQSLKQKFYEANTQSKTLQGRLFEAQSKLANEKERLKRIRDSEIAYNNLMRDYRINEEVYQDLLRRREKARVSLSLDDEQANLSSVRITEPAFEPHQPDGPPLFVFAIGGVALGSVLPMILLFGVLMIDPRIRMPSIITDELELPMLDVVPRLTGPKERRKQFRGIFWSGLVITLTLIIIIAVIWLRFQGEI